MNYIGMNYKEGNITGCMIVDKVNGNVQAIRGAIMWKNADEAKLAIERYCKRNNKDFKEECHKYEFIYHLAIDPKEWQ